MFQSTHSLRSATNPGCRMTNCYLVSIHALLAECDIINGGTTRNNKSFNPRTPCGVRPNRLPDCPLNPLFQSTHSLRSATLFRPPLLSDARSFNPRTPCGVRPKSARDGLTSQGFQSTHSLRSATFREYRGKLDAKVSIHALLAECDRVATGMVCYLPCFNPRTPCGVRPV